jgi:hypothetical protein
MAQDLQLRGKHEELLGFSEGIVEIPIQGGTAMPRRFLIAGLLIAAMAAAGSAPAQERAATILPRSGERISGRFEDIQNNIVYLRISLHDERRIPVDQVALIDFVGGTRGLPRTELAAARGPEDVLLLRDGTSIRGELLDVTHTHEAGSGVDPASPVVVTFIFRGHDGTTHEVRAEHVGRR